MFFSFVRINKEEHRKKHSERCKKIRYHLVAAAFAVVFAALAVVFCVLSAVPEKAYIEGFGEYSLQAEDRQGVEEFFLQFGVKARVLSERQIKIPEDIPEEYNNLQLSSGLDLRGYGGLEACQYICELSGDEGKMWGVVSAYKGRVVAAHITESGGDADAQSLLALIPSADTVS